MLNQPYTKITGSCNVNPLLGVRGQMHGVQNRAVDGLPTNLDEQMSTHGITH